MEKSWVLAFLLLQVLPTEGDFGVGAGIGVGIGNGDGGGGGGGASVWIGGGIDGQNPPGYTASSLSSAYTALQAWKSAITDDPLKVLRTWVGSNVCAYRESSVQILKKMGLDKPALLLQE